MTDYIIPALNLLLLVFNAYVAHLLVKQSTINLSMARMLFEDVREEPHD